MDMISNFNAPIIKDYSSTSISAKGGRRRNSRKVRSRIHKRSNKSRTRRHR
jgi:hypothetical protein